MQIDAIPIGNNPPEDVNVIIEVPIGGEPIKYEMDKAVGTLFVDRFLHTPMRYPGNYGFVPHTLSSDGDPIDVLVANTRPLFPGCYINVRPVGVLTDRDIVLEVVAREVDPRTVRVGDIMTTNPVTIGEDESVEEALKDMRNFGVRRLPVVGQRAELVGIVAVDDVLRVIAGDTQDIIAAIGNERQVEARRRP